MPEISDWWGGLLLPFLTWLAMVGIQKRILKAPSEHTSLLCKRVL